MENLLLPFLWFFMLLEWIYDSLKKGYVWLMGEPEPPRQRPNKKHPAQDVREPEPIPPGGTPLNPDTEPKQNDGREARERRIPRAKEENKIIIVYDERPKGRVQGRGI